MVSHGAHNGVRTKNQRTLIGLKTPMNFIILSDPIGILALLCKSIF